MILGIDPGATGAIALLHDDGTLIDCWDMPIVQTKVGRKLRPRVDAVGILHLFVTQGWSVKTVRAAYLEKVGPSASAAGSFTFGYATGLVHAVTVARGIPVTLVAPQMWKPAMGVPGRDKNVSRAKAQGMFPAVAKTFGRSKDDGRAEAVLIGVWGARHGG